jgi:hypothetical protein
MALLSAFYIPSASGRAMNETIAPPVVMMTKTTPAVMKSNTTTIRANPAPRVQEPTMYQPQRPQREPSMYQPQRVQREPMYQPQRAPKEPVISQSQRVRVSVVGQGVAPMNTISPAQAYALAKRAAIADAYRIIAEKVKGVRVEGYDLIKNMMIKRSSVRTSVDAMVKNANIIETNFKDGLCEVEMEIILSYTDFSI